MTSSFGLSSEQLAMRDMALNFARDKLTPHALEWDRDKYFPLETLRAAGALGMAAMGAREEYGGSGLSRFDAVLIFEALASGCPSIAAYLSVHNMCAWMIDSFGSSLQRRFWLPRLASMEVLSSYCLTEPGCGSDAAALRTKAERRGEEFVLTGEKQFISGAGAGGRNHLYVVMARTGSDRPDGISAFIVEGGTPGLSFGVAEKKMGWNAQPTLRSQLRQMLCTRRQFAWATGGRIQNSHGGAGWRSIEHRRLLARRRPGRSRQDSSLHQRTKSVRANSGQLSGASISTCGYGDSTRGCASTALARCVGA